MSMLARLANTGGGVSKTYVNDVFSTYLYAGNGATQTITNGIDLAGKGGLVWLKSRDATGESNNLFDTARGVCKNIVTNSTSQEFDQTPNGVSTFNSNGFQMAGGTIAFNGGANTYVAWTFRKAPKFFDVVTYTGDGANRTIAHSLGSVPGMIIVKRLDAPSSWRVYHNGLTSAGYGLQLNLNSAQIASATLWNSTAPTSTVFSLGTSTDVNASTKTYVAYLFAHDTAADGLIQCGSFTTDASGLATVTLGWEPQYLMWKASSTTGNWACFDTMRGWNQSASDAFLAPNLSSPESSADYGTPTATGFDAKAAASVTYIYLAIRRPNKPPTSGTQVFTPVAYTPSVNTIRTTNFPVDLAFSKAKADGAEPFWWLDRLRGYPTATGLTTVARLQSDSTAAETTGSSLYPQIANVWNAQYTDGQYLNSSASVFYLLARAPGFFDVVCYTGTGVARTVAHNLGVVPELMIVKSRSGSSEGTVYSSAVGTSGSLYLFSNSGNAAPNMGTGTINWNATAPTSAVFSIGTGSSVNGSGATYIAYLFATLPGISKVGSYTGNGTSQTINCGFSAGARFVLIKRTDSTGNWHTFDTARGIIAASDPYLLLNSTSVEVTTADVVDPDSSGFIVNQTATENLNVTSATYIYLAIA